mgnify:CR=1 FL=1
MKKLTFFLLCVLCLSCGEDDADNETVISTELKTRVLISEVPDRDEQDITFVKDSVVESYENGLVTHIAHFFKFSHDTVFLPAYQSYEYSSSGLLSKVSSYSDPNLSVPYGTESYSYSDEGRIQKIEFQKIAPSNVSPRLFSYTYDYEYHSDTVNIYYNYVSDDRTTSSEDQYVIYGAIDSIYYEADYDMHYFNQENDLAQITFKGGPEDLVFFYNTDVQYGASRSPLISNFLGDKLNTFLARRTPIQYYDFETSASYVEEYFSTGPRSNSLLRFTYTFDEHNRVQEVYTSGTSAGKNTIRYYYD